MVTFQHSDADRHHLLPVHNPVCESRRACDDEHIAVKRILELGFEIDVPDALHQPVGVEYVDKLAVDVGRPGTIVDRGLRFVERVPVVALRSKIGRVGAEACTLEYLPPQPPIDA